MPVTRRRPKPVHLTNSFPPTIRCTYSGCSRKFKNQSARARHEYSAHPSSFATRPAAYGYDSSPIQVTTTSRPAYAPRSQTLPSSPKLPTSLNGQLENESGYDSSSYDCDISILMQDISMLSIGQDELLQGLDGPGCLSHSVTGSDDDEDNYASSNDLDSDIGDHDENDGNLKVYHRYLIGACHVHCPPFTLSF